MNETFLQRLQQEETELRERVRKLNVFLFSGVSDEIRREQIALLHIQLSAMMTYLGCLQERLRLLEEEDRNRSEPLPEKG